MKSTEEIRALSTIDPELEQLVKDGLVLPPSWNKDTNIHGVRALLSQIAETQKDQVDPRFEEKDLQVPTRDDELITVRVHRLKERTEYKDGRPGMLMLHGGGYSIGDLNTGARLSRVFADLGGVAVNVDFRLAPEHPFPGPVEDAFDALAWVAENLGILGIDPAKGFVVVGESSGANMALAVSYLWTTRRKDAALQITGIYSSANSAATEETVPQRYRPFFLSMEQNAHAPVMDSAAIERIKGKTDTILRKRPSSSIPMLNEVYLVFAELYKPDPKSPIAYPIAIADPSIMPRTYFQACGLDPTRDCTLVMEQVWKDAGVQTKLDIYPGMPHVFWALGLPGLEQTRKHEADTRDGLLWLLS